MPRACAMASHSCTPAWQAALYIAKIFRTLGIDDNSAEFPFLAATGSGGDEVSRSCSSRCLAGPVMLSY